MRAICALGLLGLVIFGAQCVRKENQKVLGDCPPGWFKDGDVCKQGPMAPNLPPVGGAPTSKGPFPPSSQGVNKASSPVPGFMPGKDRMVQPPPGFIPGKDKLPSAPGFIPGKTPGQGPGN